MNAESKIAAYASALATLHATMLDAAKAVFQDNEDTLISQTIHRLRLGQAPDGSTIGTYASDRYAHAKRHYTSMNRYDLPERPYKAVNLGLRGDFYLGITLSIGDADVLITDTDPKWDKLHHWYGDVLAIPEQALQENILPQISNLAATTLRQQMDIA